MGVYAVKKVGQSDDKLVNEFNKRIQKSRIVQKSRATRYRVKKGTRRLVRQAALIREKHRADNKKKQFYS